MSAESSKAAERAEEMAERIANKLQSLLTEKYSNSEKIAYGLIKQELEPALKAYETEAREQCAQIADGYSEFIDTLTESNEPIATFGKELTKRIGAAIRAMKA